MPNDKTKIVGFAADVYISAAGADHSDGSANHTLVGWSEEGSIKLSQGDKFSIELHNATDFDLGGKYSFECMALETDAAKISALEGFLNTDIDIVLINRADKATGDVYASGTLILEPDFQHSLKNVRKMKLMVTFAAKKLTDFFSELTGATGYN